MTNFLPLIKKISDKVAPPYFSERSVSFVVEKNNCTLEIHFDETDTDVWGFVGAAMLHLNSKELSDLMFCIRQLSSVYSTATCCMIEVHLVEEVAEDLYSIFPRIHYRLQNVGRSNESDEQIADSILDTYGVLVKIGEIVAKFRVKDKSFENLANLWRKATSCLDHNEKGKLLEDVFVLLLSQDENFVVVERNLRTESEELDIVVENKGVNQFYSQLRCPMILFECKNWSSRIGAKEIRDFAQKIQNRSKLLCTLGVLATTSQLTRDASTELLGYRGKDFLIATLEGNDIETILKKRIPFGIYLKDVILKAGTR